jgi:hypothetical protein
MPRPGSTGIRRGGRERDGELVRYGEAILFLNSNRRTHDRHCGKRQREQRYGW